MFFEDLVLEEANRIVARAVAANAAGDAKKSQAAFDEAFDFFRHMLRRYPNTPGLKESIYEYLYMNAGALFRVGRAPEAFAILEDLYSQNPEYRYRGGTQTALAAMERLGDRLIGSYIDEGNYRGARMLLERLQKSYGTTLKIVATRRQQLIQVAEKKRDEAAAFLAAKQLPQAHEASREMLKIWPSVQGGGELIVKIAQQYPLVVVGVSQPALQFDPLDLANLASRRCGSLMYRTLVEYVEQKTEGGLYESPWASLQQSDDRRELLFDLRPGDGQAELSAFDVSRQLLALADPNSASYRPIWASLMESVSVEGLGRVHVDLRHPSLLPQAYLQVPLDDDSPIATRYKVVSQSETETRFETTRGGDPDGGPHPVVVERFYAKPREAISDLLKGKLDMLDRVLPNDALRLRDDPTLVVGTYAFPSIHVLVPNIENPHLANRTFRRALVYAINRQVILAQGLLNKKEVAGCQVLSAAIPAGTSRGDPSAYAYDERIKPLPYDPVMAAILIQLAQGQLDEAAEKRQEEGPELGVLVLAHPIGEQASFVCKQIQTQLEVVGITCNLLELPAGQTLPPKDKFDLLYLELTMREPLVDLGRVFGPGGIAATKEPYVALTLRQLDQAETWKNARERLHELHRLLYEDVTALPLWQMVDHFVYRKGLRGVSSRPIYLYQNVDRLRVSPPTHDE